MTSQEEEPTFEEEEVVWAKIRGYPWWPAYIDKIQNKRGEQQFTVFFFGDNTQYCIMVSAKLGFLKLRKFIDHYTTHYLTAKTNRKLMNAIRIAEDRLGQNDQEVRIFQQLRDSLKNNKEKPSLQQNDSQPSFQDESNPNPTLPRLMKSKTSFGDKRKRIQESPEKSQPQLNLLREDSNKLKRDIVSQGNDDFFQKEGQRVRERKIKEKAKSQSSEEESEDEAAFEDEKEEEFIVRKKKEQAKFPVRSRGRPRKNVAFLSDASSKQEKYKAISKPVLQLGISQHKSSKAQSDQQIVAKTKTLINSREDLIQFLDTIKITPSNAKQILDLNVSTILQSGRMDYKTRNILDNLKSSLLLNYFPDDVKNVKAYSKLSRAKSAPEESLKHEKSKSQLELTPADIRRKTTIKLQKFLKQNPEVDNPKQLAIKVESYFQKKDREVGRKYKTFAFRVMNVLRSKQLTYSEVLQKLEQNGFD